MGKKNETSTTKAAMPYDSVLCTGLNNAAKQIHEDAKRKSFLDSERETGTLLMLCVRELFEAMEADRKSKVANLDKYYAGIAHGDLFESCIKDTVEDKLADTIIQILDLCGEKGIDIEKHINLKLEYKHFYTNKLKKS